MVKNKGATPLGAAPFAGQPCRADFTGPFTPLGTLLHMPDQQWIACIPVGLLHRSYPASIPSRRVWGFQRTW
jgi:hypothetical protein